MVFSASSLLVTLFLFTSSLVAILLFYGLKLSFSRSLIRNTSLTKDAKPEVRAHLLGSSCVHKDTDFSGGIGIVIIIGTCLLFSTLRHSIGSDFTGLFWLAGAVYGLSLMPFSTQQISFNKLKLSVLFIILCMASLIVSFSLPSEQLILQGAAPFWLDRLSGALFVIGVVYLFGQMSLEPYGFQVSFMAVSFIVGVFALISQMPVAWLNVAMIFGGVGLGTAYWRFIGGQFKLSSGVKLVLGLLLGYLLLKLIVASCYIPPALLVSLSLIVLIRPFVTQLYQRYS